MLTTPNFPMLFVTVPVKIASCHKPPTRDPLKGIFPIQATADMIQPSGGGTQGCGQRQEAQAESRHHQPSAPG